MITKKEIKIKKGTKMPYIHITQKGLFFTTSKDIFIHEGSELDKDTYVITHCKGNICTAIPYDISIFNFIYKIAAAHT